MKEIKNKTCVFCGVEFRPFRTTQRTCSTRCAIGFAREKEEKKEKRLWNAEKKKRKEALLSHSEWLKLLQVAFNAYIRKRDEKEGCISCGTTANVQYAAGHFFTVGGFPNVRFDEDNVHKQCNKRCNGELSGNIIDYRPALIKKIGIERFEALEKRARTESGKMSIPEIKEKIKYYKQKIKEI